MPRGARSSAAPSRTSNATCAPFALIAIAVRHSPRTTRPLGRQLPSVSDEHSLTPTRGEQAAEGAAILLSTMPYIGGPLAEIAKGFVTRRQSRRLHGCLADVAADLRGLQGRIDATLDGSHDFEAFAERTFQAAEQTVQAEKLDALRATFLNTVLAAPPQYDRGLEIIDLLLRLQPQHLTLLRLFADPVRADAEAGHPLRNLPGPLVPPVVLLHMLLPGGEADDMFRATEVLRREDLLWGSHLKAAVENRGAAMLQGRLSPFGSRVVNYLMLPG